VAVFGGPLEGRCNRLRIARLEDTLAKIERIAFLYHACRPVTRGFRRPGAPRFFGGASVRVSGSCRVLSMENTPMRTGGKHIRSVAGRAKALAPVNNPVRSALQNCKWPREQIAGWKRL